VQPGFCFMGGRRKCDRGSPEAIKAAQPGQVQELVLPPDQLQRATLLLRGHWQSWRVSRFAGSAAFLGAG